MSRYMHPAERAMIESSVPTTPCPHCGHPMKNHAEIERAVAETLRIREAMEQARKNAPKQDIYTINAPSAPPPASKEGE